MLTDTELEQMAADAAEIKRLRDAATEWLGNFTVSDPYGYDAMFVDVTAENATVPCIQGCHHTIVELLAAAARSDNSAAHVERLVQEVRRLQALAQLQIEWGMKMVTASFEENNIPLPDMLKPYASEENVNV